jgi:hypothetical protein
MLTVVLVWLAVVGLVTVSYTLVWRFSPPLRAWMEAPRDQFLRQQRRFPRVVRRRPRQAASRTADPASLRRRPATFLDEVRDPAGSSGFAAWFGRRLGDLDHQLCVLAAAHFAAFFLVGVLLLVLLFWICQAAAASWLL